MQILDGKKISAEIKKELKDRVNFIISSGGTPPGLVAILVGNNPASEVYVNSKNKSCLEVGMISRIEKLDETISENKLLEVVKKYNDDSAFHGILVQLPLPKHIREDKIIESILPSKDVDGFHPVNAGKLIIGKDTFVPCTPLGIQELLKRYKIDISGKHVVILGRSNIVGKPVANLLLQKKDFANAVVTVCHSAAPDVSVFTKNADILIAAIGRPEFVKADMVREGAVVIDVGINRIADSSLPKGYRLAGDVDFNDVAPKTSYITPVPGGVGPMTIAMLLFNTLKAYESLNSGI